MFLSYITTESDGALTLDQLLRGPLSLSAREAREARITWPCMHSSAPATT